MGSGKGQTQANPSTPQQVTTNSTTSNIPDYAAPYFSNLLQNAQNISNDPYQQYTGQRIADFSQPQQQAFNLTQQGVGNYQPSFQQAGQSFNQATFDPTQVTNSYTAQNYNPQTWNDPTVQASYMNPYQQGVTDVAKDQSNRDFSIAQQQRNSQAAAGGAFGGYRQGIVDAEAQRNQGQLLNNIQTTGLNTAYNTGLGAFNQDRSALIGANQINQQNQQQQAQLTEAAQGANNQYGLQAGQLNLARGQAQQGLGQAYQNANNTDIQNLYASGNIQQAQQQAGLDTAYQDFINQRDYPRQNLNWFSGILRGTPITANSSTTSSSSVAPPNSASQLAGLGLGAAGLSKLLS